MLALTGGWVGGGGFNVFKCVNIINEKLELREN